MLLDMSNLSHPSDDTTIVDALYFAATEEGGGQPQSNREAFVRSMTNGPVEQQMVKIAGVLYDVGRKVDKLEEKVDRNHQEMMNLLRGFMVEVREHNHQV